MPPHGITKMNVQPARDRKPLILRKIKDVPSDYDENDLVDVYILVMDGIEVAELKVDFYTFMRAWMDSYPMLIEMEGFDA